MTQKEYLKMEDVFASGVNHTVGSTFVRDNFARDIAWFNYSVCSSREDAAKYAAHAINSHDELVSEVDRLRSHLSQVKWLCEHFANCGGWDINAYSEYVNANIEPIWSTPEEVE